ncbi:NADP-dependent oxidoreductase domain-containing protein [Aspergillus karnatakaensis]|uniref:aldo/keto reductase n=1 Tax=Aspergillus karnatakaensis TaxID=1810916 RepID=UPI003CCD0C4F
MAPFETVPDHVQQAIRDTKATYRRVGGLIISNPIMGCMGIGSSKWWDWVLEEEPALELLGYAYSKGINTWDTANVYSNGRSEETIGKAIQKYQIPREKLVLMTKVGRIMADEKHRDDVVAFMGNLTTECKDYVNQGGLSRKAIFGAVDASLRRLGTAYIDVLQIHRFDPDVPPEETMKALHDLVTTGKVHYLGASSMWAHELAQLQFVAEKNNWTKIVVMQNHYNLLYREEEREMLRFCRATGIGVIPWAPLASGLLACRVEDYGQTKRTASESQNPRFKYLQSAQDREIISRVAVVAKDKGWSMTDVSLAWLNKRVAAPVLGFTSKARVDEALSARGKELTADEERFLEELYSAKPIMGHL